MINADQLYEMARMREQAYLLQARDASARRRSNPSPADLTGTSSRRWLRRRARGEG